MPVRFPTSRGRVGPEATRAAGRSGSGTRPVADSAGPPPNDAGRPPGSGPLRPTPRAPAGSPGTLLALQLGGLSLPEPEAVAREAAQALAAQATALEGRPGIGLEQWGKGDPDVVRRRMLKAQLLDAPEVLRPSALLASAASKRDLAVLGRFDRRDAPRTLAIAVAETVETLRAVGAVGDAQRIEARAKQGAIKQIEELAHAIFAVNPGGEGREKLENLYWILLLDDRMNKAGVVNDARAQEAAAALGAGTQRFFAADPQRFSTAVLPLIAEPELRARTVVDTLLQFRRPRVRGVDTEPDLAGGAGLQAVAELRRYLATLPADARTPEEARERALARALAVGHPIASGNRVLEARQVVAKLRRLSWQLVYGPGAAPPGHTLSPYEAIHHNFSLETPRLIEAFVRDRVFGGEPRTFCALVEALGLRGRDAGRAEQALDRALAEDPATAAAFAAHQKPGVARLESLETFLVGRAKGKLDSVAPRNVSGLSAAEQKHLDRGQLETTAGLYPEKLALVARLYRTVCESLPTADSVAGSMFSAQGALPAVAHAVAALRMEGAEPLAVLRAVQDARGALAGEFAAHPEGYRRLELIALDRQLESIQALRLGDLVERVGDLSSPEARRDALGGLAVALEAAASSGLEAIRDLAEPAAQRGPTLRGVAEEIAAAFAAGSIGLDDYRALMAQGYESIVRTTENLRSYVDRRVPDVSEGALVPNPGFIDDLVKESALHYGRALAEKALAVGLEAELSPTRIVNPPGVKVLNRLGRVVFDRVLVADSMAALRALSPGRSDMCWVQKMDEKKMLAVGGIMSDFPGGYCHAAVYARGAGIAALSNPELSSTWRAFADQVAGQQLYYDDTGGRLLLMPLQAAQAAGLVSEAELPRLQPGANRTVEYSTWSEAEHQYRTIGEHTVLRDPERSTERVELFGASGPVKGLGERAMSFEAIGRLGTAARGLFGEKSLVLGLMKADPELAPRVPPGSALSTLRVQRLLADAGVLEGWQRVFAEDPWVGAITDENLLESRFYADAPYREATRLARRAEVREKLGAFLLTPEGAPTAAGTELLAELRENAELAACPSWIVRSSFTAEDRPGKSGAGQYDSFPALTTDRAILAGIVGVVASAWEAAPVENNVAEEYHLGRIWPAITVMKCLAPEQSGVAISRDTGTGHRRTVSYQAVEGFGGGVEDGDTEQGKLEESGEHLLEARIQGRPRSVLGDAGASLWATTMAAERLFHRVVEPGRGLAVDMEWCLEKGQLYVVQARTIRV